MRKFKAPDPQRSNTLPRYATDDSIAAVAQKEKEAQRLLSSSLNQTTRDEIRRLMKSENGNNNATMQKIEEKKRLEMEKRKAHEEAIYNLDLDALETTFNLPGKPGARTTLPAELSRRTPVKKTAKVNHTHEKNLQETGGMNFLPNILGTLRHSSSAHSSARPRGCSVSKPSNRFDVAFAPSWASPALRSRPDLRDYVRHPHRSRRHQFLCALWFRYSGMLP
jgi:hypothetical protein